jgi:hypothetical protein
LTSADIIFFCRFRNCQFVSATFNARVAAFVSLDAYNTYFAIPELLQVTDETVAQFYDCSFDFLSSPIVRADTNTNVTIRIFNSATPTTSNYDSSTGYVMIANSEANEDNATTNIASLSYRSAGIVNQLAFPSQDPGILGPRQIMRQTMISVPVNGTDNLEAIDVPTGVTMTISSRITAANVNHTDITGGELMVVVDPAAGGIIGTPTTTIKATTTGSFTALYVNPTLFIRVTTPSGVTFPYNWAATTTRQTITNPNLLHAVSSASASAFVPASDISSISSRTWSSTKAAAAAVAAKRRSK